MKILSFNKCEIFAYCSIIAFVCFLLCSDTLNAETGNGYDSYSAAVQQVKTGNYSDAIKFINEAVNSEPSNHSYIAYKGYILRNTGDFENALSSINKAIQLNPGTGWYYVEGVVSSYAIHDLALTKIYCKKALAFGEETLGSSNYEYVKGILENLKTAEYTLNFKFRPDNKRLIYESDGTLCIPVPSEGLPYQNTDYIIINAELIRVQKQSDTELIYLKPSGKGEVSVQCSVIKTPYSYSGEIKKGDHRNELPEAIKEYLKGYERMNPDSKILKSRASVLKGSSDIETISNIIKWINSSKRKGKPPVWKTVDDIVTGRDVECGTGSLLAVALARACGIPARQVWGPIDAGRSYSPGNYLKGHAWFEFYLRGSGWIPVEQFDVSSIGLLPPSYIRMYTTDTDIYDSNPIRNIITIMHDGKWGDIVEFKKRVTEKD
jgi:tetratricopeptide (TPR) repeat protein